MSPTANLCALHRRRSPPPPEILPGLYPCRAVMPSCSSVLKKGKNQACLAALLGEGCCHSHSSLRSVRLGATGDHRLLGNLRCPGRAGALGWSPAPFLTLQRPFLPAGPVSQVTVRSEGPPRTPFTPAERLRGPRGSSQPQPLALLAYFIYLYCYFLKL